MSFSWVPGSQSTAMTCSGSLLTCLPRHHRQRWKCICQTLGRSKCTPQAAAFPVQPHQWLFQLVLYLSSDQPGGVAIPSPTPYSSALTDRGLSPACAETSLLNLLFCGITEHWEWALPCQLTVQLTIGNNARVWWSTAGP